MNWINNWSQSIRLLSITVWWLFTIVSTNPSKSTPNILLMSPADLFLHMNRFWLGLYFTGVLINCALLTCNGLFIGCVQISLYEVCERPCVSVLLPDWQTDKETQNPPSSARVLHPGMKTHRWNMLVEHSQVNFHSDFTGFVFNLGFLFLSAHLEGVSVLVIVLCSLCPVALATHSERSWSE